MTNGPKIIVLDDATAVGRATADIVAATVRADPEAVIAVPTGTTPLPMFEAVAADVASGALDLSRIQLFCLDEYVGVSDKDPNSLTGWLEKAFIQPARIPAAHVHALPSMDPDLAGAPARYEADLRAHGGLDLAVLGLGGNGHIAYNEPGSGAETRTRIVDLTPESVEQAAGYFEGRAVPTKAMTMGVETMLEARAIVLIVTGEGKQEILRRTLTEPPTAEVPASFLQLAPDKVTVIADRAAAGLLPEPRDGSR
jgi:glucosamine-6-phosphate deaminase